MANWNGSARSNYFAVKVEEAFRKWASSRELEVVTKRHGGDKTLFGVISTTEDGGWLSTTTDDDGEDIGVSIPAEISEHLADGQVAVLMETGTESNYYLTGQATAIDSRGNMVHVSLEDIYGKIKEYKLLLEGEVSRCEY